MCVSSVSRSSDATLYEWKRGENEKLKRYARLYDKRFLRKLYKADLIMRKRYRDNSGRAGTQELSYRRRKAISWRKFCKTIASAYPKHAKTAELVRRFCFMVYSQCKSITFDEASLLFKKPFKTVYFFIPEQLPYKSVRRVSYVLFSGILPPFLFLFLLVFCEPRCSKVMN